MRHVVPVALDLTDELGLLERRDVVHADEIAAPPEQIRERVCVQLGVDREREDGPEPGGVGDWGHWLRLLLARRGRGVLMDLDRLVRRGCVGTDQDSARVLSEGGHANLSIGAHLHTSARSPASGGIRGRRAECFAIWAGLRLACSDPMP